MTEIAWGRVPLGLLPQVLGGQSDPGWCPYPITQEYETAPERGVWPRWRHKYHGHRQSGDALVDAEGKAHVFAPTRAWRPWPADGQSYC
jgi:hypothetical protein